MEPSIETPNAAETAIVEDAATTPAPEVRNTVFLGRFGLRAGWSMSIFIPIFLLSLSIFSVATLAVTGKLQQTIHEAMSHQQPKKPATPPPAQDIRPKGTVISEGLQLAATAAATLALALIERRRIAVYGIGRSRLADFLPGALWGLTTLAMLVALLRATHVLVFDSLALHGTAITVFGLKWLLAFLLVGLFEEYLTRGFLQYTLTRGLFGLAARISPTHARAIAFWSAAVIMSIVFGSGHLLNPGENRVGILMVFVAGMVFSYALWRTGSLWWAIGFHMAWDWAQSFLFGVPDSGGLSAGRLFLTHPTGNPLFSGGPDGPEGSLYVLPTMLVVALLIRFTTRPGPQPQLEPEPSPPSPQLSIV